MDIVIASSNEGKVKELREMLKGRFENVFSLNDLGLVCDIDETGTTFAENAFIKAQFVKKLTTHAVLADDSGLCVDALNGAPGVFSARYAGEDADDAKNRLKLLDALQGADSRKAKFVCALCLIMPNGEVVFAEGETHGEITDASFLQNFKHGFGYDRIFLSHDLGTTFGLAEPEVKNKVSHRNRAIEALLAKISKLI